MAWIAALPLACASLKDALDRPPATRIDLAPKPSAAEAGSLAAADDGDMATPPSPVAEIIPGSDRFTSEASPHQPASAYSDEPVTVNFVDADVREVARTILGELLGLAYSIGPTVEGKVTLQTREPLPKRELLTTFETVLRSSGLAIIYSGNIYNIVPIADAQRRATGVATLDGARDEMAGYRQLVVPLAHVSAEEMRRILEPFAPPGSVVAVDLNRNLLTLSGAGPDLAAMLEVVRTFDTDWLSAMSFALFTPRNVDAETLAGDLAKVFTNPRNPMKDLVQLVPIRRLNAVLAISPRREVLTDVMAWVNRLDRATVGAGRRIRSYSVQNGRASDLARTLGLAFGIAVSAEGPGNGTGTPDTLRDSGSFGPGGNAGGADRDGLRIIADERNNALLIYATAQEYATVEDALRQIDTAPAQVLIEATIAEVTLNDELRFGVQWFFETGQTSVTSTDDAAGRVVSKFPGMSIAYLATSTQAALNALASLTRVQVVSSPRILALTNQPAMIQVGDQVPVVTQSAVGIDNPGAPVVNAVEMRDTGVILRVTPRVNNSGIVVLEIEQEVSDVVPTTTSGIDSPTIQQRRIRSTVSVRDGETALLGGLIRDRASEGRSGVPFLKDIPAIGELFGTTGRDQGRTELLVFLRPRIVRSGEDTLAIARDLARELRSLELMTGM